MCLLPFVVDGGRKGSTGVELMSNFCAAELRIFDPRFRCAASGLQHERRTPYEIYIRAVPKLDCEKSEAPQFRHSRILLAGIQANFGLDPRLKHSGVTTRDNGDFNNRHNKFTIMLFDSGSGALRLVDHDSAAILATDEFHPGKNPEK